MGVVQVYVCKSTHPSASYELVTQAVQKLLCGPVKSKEWSVTGTAWQQAHKGRDQASDTMVVAKGSLKDLLVMDFQDLNCTVLLERSASSSLVCGRQIKSVLESLQYTIRMTMTFSGQEFALGDFVVRVGTVVKHVGDLETIAVVVVVEYTACSFAAEALPIFEEFHALLQAQLDQLKGDKLEWRPQASTSLSADADSNARSLALAYWGAVVNVGARKPGAS